MKKTQRIFISDLHLSTSDTSWYNPASHNRKLSVLTDYIYTNSECIKDVILCGDIFNTWSFPIWEIPPTYEQILEHNPFFVTYMNQITSRGINLFYIKGNHDFDITDQEIHSYIPEIKTIKYYRSGRLLAEHGHAYDYFNTPDFVTDPVYGRPIGYYISRLAASAPKSKFPLLDLPYYIDDLLEAATPEQNIYESIIEALYEKIPLDNKNSCIFMPRNNTIGMEKTLSIENLKAQYSKFENRYTAKELLQNL